ncbi:NAD(P)-binding protein [Bacillus sp. Marseille-Q3570]|uniref:NAD(P)-binding protein n=1 Tax=Bacillus sp. Marseille-Q3570 TaxID=2963522 RepID=UPI0021B7B865|nr:NAD(P)-binding protein [Bacillus sp. Marseille-Q3570]
MSHYPIMLDLEGKDAVVIGGGKVANRKIKSLVEAGAKVTVVSPRVNENVKKLVQREQINWIKKQAEAEDYQDAFVVIAATNDPDVNQCIAAQTRKNQLVNVVDDPGTGNFSVPAKLSRGRLTIAVSTGGASPIIAKRIRDELAQTYDSTYEEYMDYLFDCRQKIKRMTINEPEKQKLLEECTSFWEKKS